MNRPVRLESEISDEEIEEAGNDDCLHCRLTRVLLRYRRDFPEEDVDQQGSDICRVLSELAISENQSLRNVTRLLSSIYEEIRQEIATETGHDNPGSPFGHA